jgi:hypothetical protein
MVERHFSRTASFGGSVPTVTLETRQELERRRGEGEQGRDQLVNEVLRTWSKRKEKRKKK